MLQHFPFIANVVGCFETNGEFDFFDNNEEEFWSSALGITLQNTYVECRLGELFEDMFRQLEMYFSKAELMDLELLPTLNFFKSLTR